MHISKSPHLKWENGAFFNQIPVGVGGIDKYSTSVFLEKILRYYYISTIGVADLQAPLNSMLRSA